MPKIIAMVLTYNRKHLLHDCLVALLAQTRPCDEILVVDNASTDDTHQMLVNLSPERVTVFALPHNVGAAGGYYAGLRLALDRGADYVWAMDDDVIAEAEALERLLSANDLLARRNVTPPFLVSTARSKEGLLTNVPEVDQRRNAIFGQIWAELLDHRMVPVTRSTFVSILLPRATLQRYGMPIASMFIWGEDSEYTLRVTREQPGFLVGDSRVIHIRAINGALDIRTEKNPARVKYHFYFKRNDVYLKRRYDGPRAIIRQIRQHLVMAIKLGMRGQFSRAGIVINGTLQGIRFNPRIATMNEPFDMTGIRVMSFAKPVAERMKQEAESF